MNPLDKKCLSEGCDEYPLFGFQPVKTQPAKWACPAHQHLLYKESEPRPSPAGDLFGTADRKRA